MALYFSFTWDKFLHLCRLPKSSFLSVLEKLIMSPDSESNSVMKRSCIAQGLAFQGVSLVYAPCTMLLCYGSSFRSVICRSPLLLLAVFGPWLECGEFSIGVLWSACEMRLVATFTATDTLQNSLIGRYGVGGVYACFLGEKLHWNSASVNEKGSSTRVQKDGAWCMQVRQPVLLLCRLPQMALCLW